MKALNNVCLVGFEVDSSVTIKLYNVKDGVRVYLPSIQMVSGDSLQIYSDALTCDEERNEIWTEQLP